jgi:hypothetical protein
MKKQWIAVVVVAAVLCLFLIGCSGTGGVGGQGITITADNTSHIEHVSITITDGGTGLPNPSEVLRAGPLPAAAPEPQETQQTKSEKPSPAAP